MPGRLGRGPGGRAVGADRLCLEALAKGYRGRLFLSSRIVGYGRSPLPLGDGKGARRELRLCAFTWTETFASGFFADQPERGRQLLAELRGKPAVAGMVQNLLLATLLCAAFSPHPTRPPLALPARRSEVYERVLGGLLGEWRAEREAGDRKAAEPPTRELVATSSACWRGRPFPTKSWGPRGSTSASLTVAGVGCARAACAPKGLL